MHVVLALIILYDVYHFFIAIAFHLQCSNALLLFLSEQKLAFHYQTKMFWMR